jgi:hypothetical protein
MMVSSLDILFLAGILPLAFACYFSVIGLLAVGFHESKREIHSQPREQLPAAVGRSPSQPPAQAARTVHPAFSGACTCAGSVCRPGRGRTTGLRAIHN